MRSSRSCRGLKRLNLHRVAVHLEGLLHDAAAELCVRVDADCEGLEGFLPVGPGEGELRAGHFAVLPAELVVAAGGELGVDRGELGVGVLEDGGLHLGQEPRARRREGDCLAEVGGRPGVDGVEGPVRLGPVVVGGGVRRVGEDDGRQQVEGLLVVLGGVQVDCGPLLVDERGHELRVEVLVGGEREVDDVRLARRLLAEDGREGLGVSVAEAEHAGRPVRGVFILATYVTRSIGRVTQIGNGSTVA